MRKVTIEGTTKLARLAFDCELSALPSSTVRAGKRLFLDSLACLLASLAAPRTGIFASLAESRKSGGRILGIGPRWELGEAIHQTARLVNFLDYDETFMMQSHHGAAAFAASAVLGDYLGLGGKSVLESFIYGYEVASRVCRYLTPVLARDANGEVMAWEGYAGPIGAAFASCAAATKALGLTAKVSAEALAICPAYTAVRLSGWRNGWPTAKYYDVGFAAYGGYHSTVLARSGDRGRRRLFEEVLGPSIVGIAGDMSAIVSRDPICWIAAASVKPWPCCRWFHYPLTALQRLVADVVTSSREVKSVELRTFRPIVSSYGAVCSLTDCWPETVCFDIRHAAVMLLLGVPAGAAWYGNPKAMVGHEYNRLYRLVTLAEEPMARIAGKWRLDEGLVAVPSGAILETTSGRFSATVDLSLGDPWKSDDLDQLVVGKFLNAAESHLSSELAAQLVDHVWNIESVSNIRTVFDLLDLGGIPRVGGSDSQKRHASSRSFTE